jgi:amidohydrolase
MAQALVSSKLIENVKSARHALHKKPELSLEEKKTSDFIVRFLCSEAPPDQIFTDIGGNGVIAIYNSGKVGPIVMFRAELDALPITEINSMEYKSECDGVSHKCGHDGHMATVLGLAGVLRSSSSSPTPILKAGKVMVLFQPAEEVGSGAASMLADPIFRDLIPTPDYIFAFHNVPGYPLGTILLKDGSFSASVRRYTISLFSKHSLYSEPFPDIITTL